MIFSEEGLRHLVAELGASQVVYGTDTPYNWPAAVDLIVRAPFLKDAEKEAKQEGENDSWLPNLPDFKRGASTISQQLAKNLYLSSERSFMRKGQEAIITYFMERELSKHRILELYLNVIEWGDGIYGAEAASQYYFHKPAQNLNAREGAFLSAMIPNPRTVFNPQVNPKRVARRQRVILRLMPSVKMPAGTG